MNDKSASMTCSIPTGGDRWTAMKDALTAFVSDPGASGLGVGIQYFGLGPNGDSCDVTLYTPAEYRDPNDLWIGNNLHLLVILQNTKVVPEGQGPKSWADLLDPKWQGKTTLKDPRDPGGGSPLLFLYHNPQLGPEYIKKLLAAGLTLVRDERQQTDWLASGKFPIAITAKAEEVDEAKRRGLPVNVLDAHAMREGAGLEAGGTMISLMNRAPHPNASEPPSILEERVP